MKKTPTKEDLKQRDDVQANIKERAYLIAESEGFPHGRDLVHWLQAEEEILARHMREFSDMVRNAVVRATKGEKSDGKAVKVPVKTESKPAATAKTAAKSKPTAKPATSKPKPAAKPAAAKSAPAKSSGSKTAPKAKKSSS